MIQLHIYQGKLVKHLNKIWQQISKKKTDLTAHSQAIVPFTNNKGHYWPSGDAFQALMVKKLNDIDSKTTSESESIYLLL
jgi:hypothetical protein